ncbi:hypothetical protein QQP08_018832, partial [Theobroma cacao]
MFLWLHLQVVRGNDVLLMPLSGFSMSMSSRASSPIISGSDPILKKATSFKEALIGEVRN